MRSPRARRTALWRHAFAAMIVSIGAVASAQTPDTRAILIREAQRSDERLFAYYGRFKAELIARYGGDPLLSKLQVSEVEAQALVHPTRGAAAEHVIWQEGKWISTANRQLRPWVSAADAQAHLFALSAVGEKRWRDKFRGHREKPQQAADHLGDLTVGYFGAPFNRLAVEVRVGSLSTGTIDTFVFDAATGEMLDVKGAVAKARADRDAAARREAAADKAVANRDLIGEAAQALAAFRQNVGPAKLMAVWIERDKIAFVQTDRVIVDYDRRSRFARRAEPYTSAWLCADGFADADIDWRELPALVEKAMLAGNMDDEDRAYAAIDVERPRECAPPTIEVKFNNYRSPKPYVRFDARGRLQKTYP
jgi:hypothetical protein